MANSDERALIIVDHGSRERSANAMLEELSRLVVARIGARARVHFAHMELCAPDLDQVIDDCVRDGAREVTVQPLFLAAGRHASRDIPRLVAAARARHPRVTFRIGEVLGADPLLAELVIRRSGMG